MKRALRALLIVAVTVPALIGLGSLGTWALWNDGGIGGSVSGWISGSLAGQGGPRREALTLGRIHYDWIPATRSFLFGGTAPFVATDVGIWDPEGREVIHADHATGRIAVGWVAWPQILHLAIPGYPSAVEVHLYDVHIDKARALITPTSKGPVNIVAAFGGKAPSPPDPTSGIHLTVDRATLEDVEFTMDFPGWRAELNHARIELPELSFSSWLSEQGGPERPAFRFRVSRLVAPRGRLLLGGSWEFPIERFDATRFGSEDPRREDLGFDATAVARGAPATIHGRLVSAYGDQPGVDCGIRFEHGAGLAAMLPGDGLVGGDPSGEVRFHGPFRHVLIDGRARGAELRVAGLAARALAAAFLLDGDKLALTEVAGDLGGGRIGGAVDIDFRRLDWKARLRTDGVDPSTLQPLVPRGTREVLGGSLDGTASAGGSFVVHPERVSVTGLDARLSRRGGGPLPRTVVLGGDLGVSPDRIRLDGFRIEGRVEGPRGQGRGAVSATFHGEVLPGPKTLRTEVALSGHGLGALLQRFGAPPVAGGLSAHGTARGSLLEPVVDAEISATEVGVGDRRLPRVDAHLHLERGRLAATRLHGDGFGGTIEGEGSIGLFDGPFTRRLREPTVHVDVQARRLRVHTILDLPAIRGELSGRFGLDGSLAHPKGSASLDLPALTIYDDPYHGGVFTGTLDDTGLLVERISLERDRGGRFSGKGRVGWDGALDVQVEPRDFPLQAIPPLRDSPVALGGMLAGLVHLGGALGKWIPGGVIDFSSIRVREFLFGDGRIDLKPDGDLVRVAGAFFSDFKFRVDGWITLTPSVAGDVTLTFEELPLDRLIPEMKKLVEVKSLASGTARVRFDLPRSSADIELRLSRLALRFTGELDEAPAAPATPVAAGQPAPSPAPSEDAWFENPPGEDIVVRWDGRAISFDNFHLLDRHAERGERPRERDLRIAGRLSPDGSDASVKGRLELRFLEFLGARLFRHTHGEAVADVRVLGPLSRPRLLGTLDLDNAELVPQGADEERPILVPEGRLEFTGEGVRLHHLRATLDDRTVIADGSLALSDDWQPGAVSLDLAGQVSATPLEWLFPDHVTEAQGHFDVALRVRGAFPTPTWSGQVVLPERPGAGERTQEVAFREKKLGRDVRIRGGTLSLRGWDIEVGCPAGSGASQGCRPLSARIDDSSELQISGLLGLRGESVLAPRLRSITAHVVGENIEVGSSGVFSLSVSPDLWLEGDDTRLRLSTRPGAPVKLVSGRYYQNFDILNLVIRPRTDESEPPFYAGIPLLEQMELAVSVVSSGPLFIRDNVADLFVSLPAIDVSGTLAHPALDGTVFVEAGGRFTIPLLRGEFVSEQGSITFEADREFPERTPRLDIRASTDWQDRYDQIHHINLMVTGTYQEPNLDLSSTDGWDKNQVLAAMVTGGTPDQLRRAVTEPSRATTTTSGSGGNTVDGVMKSATGQLMKPIEDPLKQAIGLDLVRIELGYDSVLIKLCPVNKPTYRLCGTGDVGFVTTTRYDARVELKLSDYLSVGGALERIEHGVDTTEDVITRGKLQLSLRYPLF